LAFASMTGCADEYPSGAPPRTPHSEETLEYRTASAPLVSGSEPPESPPPGAVAVARTDPAHVLVLQSTHLDRPAEVVGVVDAHVAMGSHDSALDVVRQRAAALGADAVVGVEFHHGEGEGQPTHLSGLAVRFIDRLP
jgi:hypothetical protein